MDSTSSVLKYQRHLDAKAAGRLPRRRPHWWRLTQLRQYRPDRPDQLAELWRAWLESHEGDLEAALGQLVADRMDSI